MSIINNMPSRPGVEIDGIIQSYYVYAGENISAGSFVEFVNGVANQNSTSGGNAYQITSTKTSYIDACVVGNKVFIMYTMNSQGYARIIEVINNTIYQRTQYSIPYSSSSVGWSSCCAISSNKVFLAAESTSGGMAIIANISGNTITFVGNGSAFYNYSIQPVHCGLWQPDKVLICFTRASNNYPMYVLATIANDSITYGAATTISTSYSSNYIRMCSLGWSKYFVMYYNNKTGTTTGWYGHILYTSTGSNILGTSATLINDNVLTRTSQVDFCAINPNIVLLLSDQYSMLVRITNNNAINYDGYKFMHNDVNATLPFCCLIDTNKAVINFNDTGNSSYPTSRIANIKGNTITYGEKFVFYTVSIRGGIKCFLVDKGKISLYYLCLYSSNSSYAYFQVLFASGDTVSKTTSYEKQVRNVTQALCDGLSNTAGTGGTSTAHNQSVEVYVPKDQFQLIANGDFNDGTNNWVANYATVMTDATYGNYLACTWNYNSSINAAFHYKNMTDGKTDDKFYICCNAKGYSANTGRVCLYCCEETIDITNNDTWGFYSKTFTASSSILDIDNTRVSTIQYSATRGGNKLDITNIRVFNLTQMFGSGNEPDKTWCDKHLGGDIS